MSAIEQTPQVIDSKTCRFIGGPLPPGVSVYRPEFQDRYVFSEFRGGKLILHIYRYAGVSETHWHLNYEYVGEQEAEVWSK